jgi:hypothetical protein
MAVVIIILKSSLLIQLRNLLQRLLDDSRLLQLQTPQHKREEDLVKRVLFVEQFSF